MSRDERERLQDIKDAITAVRAHLNRAAADETGESTPLLHDALLFQFVVIGEAVKHLAVATRESMPDVPWADIAAMRDLVTHEYFRIDIELVIATAERDLPSLAEAIDRLLQG